VAVDRQVGLDGTWGIGEKQPTVLDVTGSTARLAFRGRVFVFEGVGRLRGLLTEDAVSLAGDGLRIEADGERVEISSGESTTAKPLAELAVGGRFVYRGGALEAR